MKIAKDKIELSKIIDGWKRSEQRIGFVPTMGALHEGHISLVNIARGHAYKIVASIFVNPAQFAPHEDFSAYPRPLESDLEKLGAANVDLVYLPTEQDIYPGGVVSDLKAGSAGKGLESDFRPHFFDGVVSVVARLFRQVRPDVAVFGEKDYQQLCVVKRMVEKEKLPVEIIGGPTTRDAEGLALSSRNTYLSAEELIVARRLNKILFALAEKIRQFPEDAKHVAASGPQKLLEAGFDSIDYVELRAEDTLWPMLKLLGPARLLAAARIGTTRLIDNVGV